MEHKVVLWIHRRIGSQPQHGPPTFEVVAYAENADRSIITLRLQSFTPKITYTFRKVHVTTGTLSRSPGDHTVEINEVLIDVPIKGAVESRTSERMDRRFRGRQSGWIERGYT